MKKQVGKILGFLYVVYLSVILAILGLFHRKNRKRIDVERYVYPPKD